MRGNRKTGASHESAIAELVRLSDSKCRERLLRSHPSLLRPEVVEKLAESIRVKVRVNLDEARRTAEAALQIAKTLGDRGAIARGLRAKANALHSFGQNKAAAALHAEAALLFESEGDIKELGRTLSTSIQPLILLGEYDRALAAGRRAQRIFARSGDRLRLARLQINIGNIYFRQDRFSEALPCYEQANTQLVRLSDAEGIASSLHNMAVCLTSLNDFRRATAAYEEARAFCRRHHMPLAVVQADYNIAYLHYLRGEYSAAIEMLRAARDQADKIADAYHAALCRLDLADIYLELNLIEEAAATAQEAFLRFQKLEMGYEAAKALTSVALAAGRQGKTERALELLLQARTAFSKERNTVWPSIIDLMRATILLNRNQHHRSRELCLRALKAFEASQLSHRAILCRLVLARVQLQTGNAESAQNECLRALREPGTAEAPFLAHQLYLVLGRVQEAREDYAAAHQAYQRSRELLETLRSNLQREELKIAFVQDRLEVYERLVKICLARRSSAAGEAFRYIEEAKSRSLREAICRYGQPLRANSIECSKPLRRVHEIREALNWYYHRIEQEHLNGDKGAVARCRQLEKLAQAQEKELLRRLREMPQAHASFVGVYRPGSITLREVRQALGPDAVLVEFFRVGRQFLAAVVTPERCEIIPVADVSSVEASIGFFRFQLAKFRLGARRLQLFQETLLRVTQAHLQELYRALVEPIRHLLQVRHLVVVPHAALHYLPFHALFDGQRYLIDSYTISYAPSASIFVLCHRSRRPAAGPSLVLGVPDPRAPSILSEVEEVSTLLPDPELFVGKNATEEILRKRGPACAFIHISTHAYFRQDNPLFSGIRLGASYLTLLDLYQMNLPAQLVTLSGCATGMSVVAGGDEILGLVRGFLAAGSRSLLTSLWDVHDRTTTVLMKSFYRRLREGQERAVALQSAMGELRADYPHPYYWAPFVLVGARFS